MAIDANSYGTVEQVAALVPMYSISGDFTVATNPTEAQVEAWIDQISDVMNTYLSEAGFTIPLTVATNTAALFVTGAAADMCHYVNNAGRFYTERALEIGFNPIQVISKEIARWVEQHAEGLENRGEARTKGGLSDIGYRGTDESGDEITPIFQRKGFGNRFDNFDD